MKDGAVNLQGTLSQVLRKSKDAIPDTTKIALEELHRLDTIKQRMESTKEVLRDAESWSTLELEVTSLLAERNYAKAAERLAEAYRSMVIFQNTPEFESRRTLMVNLQNQLEASLSSAVISAINSQDTATCKDYFSIFSIIQRESEFRNYYNASRRSSITAIWQNAQQSDSGASSSPQDSPTFKEFLPKFYSEFLSVLNNERTLICAIFPDPANTISQFITTTMSSLQPSFPQRLSSVAAHHGEQALSELISILIVTEDFAVGVKKIMEKVEFSSIPLPLQEKPGHVRRRSSRMSMSLRTGSNRSLPTTTYILRSGLIDAMEWDQELFQPFIDFQIDYSSLERRYLEHSLNIVITGDVRSNNEAVDKPRLLRERAVDIFAVAEGSLSRCNAFTHGYGALGLLQALDSFLQSFIDMWIADTHERFQSSIPSAQSARSDGDLSDMDYTSQDWADIQMSMHLLGSARAIFERLSAFETRLRSFLNQLDAQFRLSESDPANFLIAPTRGEAQLLEQSTLNSSDLHNLLQLVNDHKESMTSGLPSPSIRKSQSTVSQEPLLVSARNSLFSLAQAYQKGLQKSILSPLKKHLGSYANASTWSTPDSNRRHGDLRVPSFSLSPTETVQRVAEGILNLPRLFEVYADDDALAFSLQTLPYIPPEMLKVETGDAQSHQGHRRRSSVSVLIKSATIDPEVVSSAWLISLAYTFLEYLTGDVLPSIPSLTPQGASQLSSDMEYLSNIVRALNVEHEALNKWRLYSEMSDDEGKRLTLEKVSTDQILQKIGKQRGWC
ncbi:Golgi complex component 7-domain-containing protein [Cyathus striatus]|nr:Golgi complex component 7-domain-containing protein [Cyathus striatus]